jgi:hypothetical protein
MHRPTNPVRPTTAARSWAGEVVALAMMLAPLAALIAWRGA